MCSTNQTSEMKDVFAYPKLKKPAATRANRFEQFLWKELFDEYIRYYDRIHNVKLDKSNSEYFDQYCKDIPPEDEVVKQALINQYPLYCTRAITLWNHDGDITKDFKKRYSITRPVSEQTEMFG